MATRSHGLRRELTLRDLVMMQVVLIVGFHWTGFAAKQGSSQVLVWLLAIVCFYLPLAGVVMKLSRAMPVEGGIYQWVKAGISPFAGFMAAWGITTYVIVNSGSIGSQLASGFAWAAGPSGAWMGTSKWFSLLMTALFCVFSWFVNVRGLRFTKWLTESCGYMWGVIVALLAYLLVAALLHGGFATPHAVSLTLPGFSLLTVGVLAKMSIGALSGFDSSAVFAEECRKPENDVARSVFIAAPAIALMYMLSTASLLAYTVPANIDLAAPIQQAIRAGFGSGALADTMILILVAIYSYALIVSFAILIGMVGRLPMVAGWDGLLPAWWSELHPKWRTPSRAIAAVCALIMLMAVIAVWGAENQEAFEALNASATASLCAMYALLFATILFGFRDAPERPGLVIKLGAALAFSVALVSFVLQIVPLGEVRDAKVFAVKVIGVVVLTIGIGAGLYWRGASRSKHL
jgi:amino acid transporter